MQPCLYLLWTTGLWVVSGQQSGEEEYGEGQGFLLDGSPITKDLVDTIYEAFLVVYSNASSLEMSNSNMVTSNTTNLGAEDRILDVSTLTNLASNVDLATTVNTLTGIFNFITANMDVLTAIGLVRHLENRASYDPRFRESFPDFLKDNAWFLPEKKYKLIPRMSKSPRNVIFLSNKYLHNHNMKNNQDYKEAYKQQINSQNSENDFDDNHEYGEEVLYNTEPSVHEYNTHPSHHDADYDDDPYNTNTVTGGNGNYQQPHNIHSPTSSYGSIDDLHNYVDDDNEGFGPDFTKDFFESANLNKGFFDENFPGSNKNSGSSIFENQSKYKGKRQTPVFSGQNNEGYNKLNTLNKNIRNLSNKPQSSLNNRPVRNNNLNQIFHNQQQNNRNVQNQNQFQPNVGNLPDTYSSDYDDFEDATNPGPAYQYQVPGRRPLLYNQNFQRPQLAQLQGGGLNRGPLLNDLVYRNNGQNNINQQNLNGLPFGLQNRPNNFNQQHQSGLQNSGQNRFNSPNRNPIGLQNRPNNLNQQHQSGLQNSGPNRFNQPNLNRPNRNPIGLQNSVPMLGRPVRLAGNNAVRFVKKDSTGFMGFSKIKLRL